MNKKPVPSPTEIMKTLSPQDFLMLGADHIAYVRPAKLNERDAWALHAADGKQLSVHLSEPAAVAATRDRDLRPMRLH